MGHGHVYDEEVVRFSHGFRLEDSYEDEDITNKRSNKEQTVDNGETDSPLCRMGAARSMGVFLSWR